MGGEDDVLFFAGEHASDPDYGLQCVNGAYNMGLIADNKILNAIGKIDGSMHWSDLDEY